MGWKGSVENKTIKGEKYGTLYYLAQWQGLRGENLDIEPSEEPHIGKLLELFSIHAVLTYPVSEQAMQAALQVPT